MKLLIEIGAYDGIDSLDYHRNGYKVYTFEPKKDLYENLIEYTKHLTDYTAINKAVCLFDGKTTFNICKQGGASSILSFRPEDELIQTWSENRTDIHYSGESYEVETIRLDTFIETYHLENEIIDFLHIDAQGVDLDVLKSLGKYLKNVKAGVVETVIDANKSIYVEQNGNTFEHVKIFLEQNNFIITDIKGNDNTNCEYNVYFENSR